MRIIDILRRIVDQIFNDKRSLTLILIAPLFIITLIYLLLGDSDYKASLAQSGLPSAIVESIENQDITVSSLSVSEGRKQVEDGKIDALLYADADGLHLVFKTSETTKISLVQKAVVNAMTGALPASSIHTEFIFGDADASMFDSLGYVMLGIVSFFIIFIIAGVSFVRERTNQTMERLMMTPVRRWQVVLGYTMGFGFFAVLQSIILLSYTIFVLNMTVMGSAVTAALVMILLALSAVCIGAFFSIFSNNEFQIMQFIPIVVIPQIFFSGIISIDTLPYHLGVLSKIMPVYYACSALKTIMIMGGGFADIWRDILALFLFILLFFFVNVLALKKYRKI